MRDELSAAITEAHKNGLKVTGHLCSVTQEEVVQLGVDNLEQGSLATHGWIPTPRILLIRVSSTAIECGGPKIIAPSRLPLWTSSA
jgi:hypothetical protein